MDLTPILDYLQLIHASQNEVVKGLNDLIRRTGNLNLRLQSLERHAGDMRAALERKGIPVLPVSSSNHIHGDSDQSSSQSFPTLSARADHLNDIQKRISKPGLLTPLGQRLSQDPDEQSDQEEVKENSLSQHMRVMDSSGEEDEVFTNIPKVYDPDLHLQTAIRIHKRKILLECIKDAKRIAPINITKAATRLRQEKIDPKYYNTESEFVYPILWGFERPNLEKLAEEKCLANNAHDRATTVAKIITFANYDLLSEYADIPKSTIKENLTSHEPSVEVKFLNRLRLFWYSLRNNMTDLQTTKKFDKLIKVKIPIESYPDLYLMADFLLVLHMNCYWILDYDQVMGVHDNLTSRYLALSYSSLSTTFNIIGVPTQQLLVSVYNWGDQILKERGNDGYNIIKVLEPVCTGVQLNKYDILDISHRFYTEILQGANDDYSYSKIEQLYKLIFDGTNTSVEIFEVFGCYRHFAHPTVDEVLGCKKMKEQTRKESVIHEETVSMITGYWVKHTVQNFINRNGRWPICTFDLAEDHILNYMAQHNVVVFDEYSNDISSLDWAKVIFSKEFEFDYFPDFTTLLADKALTPYLENWARVYCRDLTNVAYNTPMKEKRRLLLQILQTRVFDIKGIMDQIRTGEVPESWLTIALHAKERELKIAARMFAMLVLEMRMYFCATEANLRTKILPFNTCQTMTLSESELFYHIQHITDLGSKTPHVYVGMSLDYEKWNNRWRDESATPILEKCDQLLGTPGLLSFTHKFFQRAYLYLSSYLSPPDHISKDTTGEEKRPIPPKHSFKESDTTWYGQEGGIEGQRQVGWTLPTTASLLATEARTGIKSIITGSADNQHVTLEIPIRVVGLTASDYVKEYPHLINQDCEEYLKVLTEISGDIGMTLKVEETWVSQKLFNYGKEILIEGIFLTNQLKKVSRAYLSVSDTIPSLANRIASIHTATHATACKGNDVLLPYFIAVLETSLLVSIESKYNLHQHLELVNIAKAHGIQTNSVGFLFFVNILSKDFGGFPIMPFTEYLYRGHPDPLTSYLTWLKSLSSKHVIAEKLYLSILSLEGINPEIDYLALIQDPTSLNWIKPVNGVNIMKKTVERTLSSKSINADLKQVINIGGRTGKSTKGLVDSLMKIEPCSPRILNTLMRCSPEGARADWIATFIDMKTMKGLLDGRDMISMRDRLIKCDIAWYEFIVKMYKNVTKYNLTPTVKKHMQEISPKAKSPEDLCTYKVAEFLRTKSWKRQIHHVTVPHPLEQTKVVNHTEYSESLKCSNPEYIMYVYIPPKKYLVDSRIEFSRGKFNPYYGSTTAEKKSTRLINLPQLSRKMEAPKELYITRSWVCKDGSNLSNFISALMRSRTSLPMDMISAISGISYGGSISHRYADVTTKHSSHPNIRTNSFTNFYISSDSMGAYSKGLENYTMHFQGLFLSALTTLTTRYIYGLENPEKRAAYVQYVSCYDCCHKIDESLLETPQTKFNVPSVKGCKILFVDESDVDVNLTWMENPLIKILAPHDEIPELSKIQSCALAQVIIGTAKRDTVPKIKTPLSHIEVHHQEPSITLASMLKINFSEFIHQFSVIWLCDNIMHILETTLQNSIDMGCYVRCLLVKTSGSYWSYITSFIVHEEVRNQFLAEMNRYPSSSQAFHGEKSLPLTLASLTAECIQRMINSPETIEYCLIAPYKSISLTYGLKLYLRSLILSLHLDKTRLCMKYLKALERTFRESICDGELKLTILLAKMETEGLLHNLGLGYHWNFRIPISLAGPEPWLKLKDPNPNSKQVLKVLIDQKEIPHSVKSNAILNSTKIHISITPKRYSSFISLDDVNELDTAHIDHILQQSQYHEHMIKLTGRYSTSHYKYLSLLIVLDWLHNVQFAVCLADGSGGVSRLLYLIDITKNIYYHSMIDIDEFPPHRATNYKPAELLDIDLSDKFLFGVETSILYGGDLLKDDFVEKLYKDLEGKVYDLITFDAETNREFTTEEYIAFAQVIIHLVKSTPINCKVIFKTYSKSTKTLLILVNLFSSCTRDLKIIEPYVSSFHSVEVFLCFISDKLLMASQVQSVNLERLDYLDTLSINKILSIPFDRLNAIKSQRLLKEHTIIKDLQLQFEQIGFPLNLENCLYILTGGYVLIPERGLPEVQSLCQAQSSLYMIAVQRFRDYVNAKMNRSTDTSFFLRYSKVFRESKELYSLVEYLHNIDTIILLITNQRITPQRFYKPYILENSGVVIFTYVPDLKVWKSKYGRAWYKLYGHIHYNISC